MINMRWSIDKRKAITDKAALDAIERHGLYVIRDGNNYAISIDNTGDQPTAEQRQQCWWYYGDPGEAAYAYCKRNNIKLDLPWKRKRKEN